MAAAFDGSITPPPPSGIRTPPTPRLGYHDNWEPFTPRKSARISSQRARTPSPNSSNRQQLRSPRTTKKSSKHSTMSPIASPQKKRLPALDSVRRASGFLTAGSSQAAAALGINETSQRPTNSSASRATGMLPTPSKTPVKPPNEKTAANIKSIARNLFPSDAEVMPSPKKRRTKKYTGISLESFTAEEIEEPIEIFTDSQDRIPTKDESESNPFYGDAAPPSPSKRRSKRRHVNIPGEGALSIDDASRREDGMVYVFRGKKFFRKFSDDNDTEDLEELDDEIDEEVRLARPLTRSSIKPRLLFQTPKTQAMIDEEEAATDIEDQLEEEPVAESSKAAEVEEPQTPAKIRQLRAGTPEAPKFAPVSPPDTRRTTRSTNKLAEQATPIKTKSRRSPFDSWRRTKGDVKATSGTKRQADDSIAPAQTKRTRT